MKPLILAQIIFGQERGMILYQIKDENNFMHLSVFLTINKIELDLPPNAQNEVLKGADKQ